ncbi:MAG: hypothetical protein Q4A32_00890, partial [Lachnospiraceae bacterium]|nr:hypothetical protein [Lachnospiraceae bacterium]
CEIEPNNYQVVDMNFRFDTAYIDLGDEVIKVKVKSWTDFDEGVQVQVTAEDGKVYLASQSDCVLVYEKGE